MLGTFIEISLEKATKELWAFTYLLHSRHSPKKALRQPSTGHVDGFRRRAGFDMALWVSATPVGCPRSCEQASLRIVQEALVHLHRYTIASHVLIYVPSREIDPAIRDSGRQRDKGR
jgi:signal transduction histidine kinase